MHSGMRLALPVFRRDHPAVEVHGCADIAMPQHTLHRLRITFPLFTSQVLNCLWWTAIVQPAFQRAVME